MRLSPALAALGFVALCATSSAMAAGEVYKWTNDAGVVQYTDSPPDGRPFEKIVSNTSRPPVSVEDASDGTVTDPETEVAADAAPRPGTAASNCDVARKNVESITKFPDVKMDRDGDGTAEVLTADERTAELARNQGLVDIYCPKEADTQG